MMDGALFSRRGVLAGTIAVALAWPAIAAGQPAIAGVVAAGSPLRQVYAGGQWCEGPVWDRRGGALVFSDVKANRLLRLGAGGNAATIRAPSGNANGNGFDRQGRLLTCEHLGRRLVRQEPDGRLTVLADRYRGKRLNSPNDLAVAADGAIWFTDPTYGITQPDEGRQSEQEQPGQFVFRLDPNGRLDMVSDSFEQPNGIVFSPDGRMLYVSDTSAAGGREGRREIHAFDVIDGKRLARERVFARVDAGVADGLAVDAAGRLYAGTERGATVWDAGGARLGLIATPSVCANIAFGGADGRTLFLCAGSAVHAIDTRTTGAEWS